ncbi:MAG: hypothetical protein ACJ8AA_11585 [Gemmatimonadaceae bacterium]
MRDLLRTVAALAFACGTIACSSATNANTKTTAAPKADPDVISTSEIDSQPFRDAYDIVQVLRPTWFTRKSAGATTRRIGVSTSNSAIGAGLVVYVDNSRMGGVEALRQLTPNSIESLRFMDAATATAKLPGIGTSVVSGAIVARSRRGL